MKPNSKTQSDQGLGFDGAGSESTGKVRGGLHVNHYTGYMNDGRTVNKGRGPTKGNQDYHGQGGPSVTRDKMKTPPASAVPSLPAQGSVRDNINRGAQVRNPGGTRDWMPSAGQNYRGNPDSIRVGQSGGPGYGGTTGGRRPATAASSSNFNFGPKSQY